MSIAVLTGIFVSMVRAIQLALAIPAFIALLWVTGLVGNVVEGWMPAVLSVTGAWGFLGGLIAFVAACYAYVFWSQRRHERHVYATTGIIEVEKPHPWPMWLRVLPFVLPALGMIAVVIAAANGK